MLDKEWELLCKRPVLNSATGGAVASHVGGRCGWRPEAGDDEEMDDAVKLESEKTSDAEGEEESVRRDGPGHKRSRDAES
jgi:hypothetical protein